MQGDAMIETQVNGDASLMWAAELSEIGTRGEINWQMVDRVLRGIARRRAALDADEARWLREAERLEIWRPLGMVSALDYLERVLGHAPRTAQERLRVARALGTLPLLSGALTRGELAFSGVRELTRVATPTTEAAWLRAATGKNLRQIEELVADHRPGDRPDDPPDPQARRHVVRFELSAGTFARLRQTRVIMDRDHGSGLDDDGFVAALCDAVLDGGETSEPSGRARYQIAMTVCARCRQGWQEGGGAQITVDAATVERAACDAQHVGSIDGDTPERAYQDIPPSVARLVWRRDGGRCRVPGCRSARGLELHHLVHRADGGGHDASNLVLACSACHQAHHAGTLTITGTADALVVRRPAHAVLDAERAHVDACSPIDVERAHVDARTPIDVEHAHVDACTPIDVEHAHVDACTPIIPERAHVDACTPIVPERAHVDACTPIAPERAHVDACTPIVPERAHVDACTPIVPERAHVDACAPFAPERAHVDACAPFVPERAHVDARTPIVPERAQVDARTAAEASTGAAPADASATGGSRNASSVTDCARASAGNKLTLATRHTQTKAALRGLGWSASIAQAAAAATATQVGPDASIEQWIREALRHCPRPVTVAVPPNAVSGGQATSSIRR